MDPAGTATCLLTANYPGTGDPNWSGLGYTYTDTTPAVPAGAHVFSSAPGRLIMGRSNYIGVAGDWRTVTALGADYRGLMYYKSKNALAKTPDGTSNTWLFGEMCGGFIAWNGQGGIPNGVCPPSKSSGFNYTAFGLQGLPPNPPNGIDPSPQAGQSIDNGTWARFGSLHSGLTNFGYADGSIRPLNNPGSISFPLTIALSGYQDGVVISQQ
jgi:prepilin-type processing-associated H-X9-DG protein